MAALPMSKLKRGFQQLAQNASKDFKSEGWKGTILEQLSIDTRYCGQGYELSIPFSLKLISDFHHAHAQRYGYSYPNREIELVTLRLRATMKFPPIKFASRDESHRLVTKQRTQSEQRRVIFDGKLQPTRVYERDQLVLGKKYSGPAVVTEYSATTIVPPRMQFSIDRASNLLIEVR
jgi:N-methylhydantoinase A